MNYLHHNLTFKSTQYNKTIIQPYIIVSVIACLNFTGTHSIQDVDVRAVSESQLRIRIHIYSHIASAVGAFVSLLFCKTIACNNIDYEKSLYFSTYGRQSFIYNVTHTSGNYLLYAYDTEVNGSLIPTTSRTSYPIPGRRIFLHHDEGLPRMFSFFPLLDYL